MAKEKKEEKIKKEKKEIQKQKRMTEQEFVQLVILQIIVSVFIFINFILCFCLLGQFSNNEIMTKYKNNWKMVPIKSITTSEKNIHYHFNKKNNKLNKIQKRLGYFPGTELDSIKNLKEIKGGDILVWRNHKFNIELMDEPFYYYDLLKYDKNKIQCGTDEKGNSLYFPEGIECPINYISITDNENDNNCVFCNNTQLTENKYLHISNQEKGKIVVQVFLQDFCDFFYNCKNESEIYSDSNKNNIIDNQTVYNLMKENGYILNTSYLKSENDIINLYYSSYFGLKEDLVQSRTNKIKKYMKFLINYQNYCKIKNIFINIFNIAIVGFFVLSFFFPIYNSLMYLIILILVFIRFILCLISIFYFNQMTKHLFKNTDELSYYKNNNDSNFLRIEETVFIFDQCIFVIIFLLFYININDFENLNKFPIVIEFLKAENIKKLIKKIFCCEIEKINEKTVKTSLLIDNQLKSDLRKAKNNPKELKKIIAKLVQKFGDDKEIMMDEKEIENNENNTLETDMNSNPNLSQVNSIQFNFLNEHRQGGCGGVDVFIYQNKLYVLKSPIQDKDENIENFTGPKLIKLCVNINCLEKEIKFLKQLDHPNIIKFKAKRIKNKIPRMVIEYAKGGSLEDLLKNYQNNQLPLNFKLKLIKQLADALIYIHNKNIIHCDIKPANILLDKEYKDEDGPNNYPNLKLIDFGLSVYLGEKVPGYTILYTAPEIFLNKDVKANPSLDVFIFGSVCYEILTQKKPYYEKKKMIEVKNAIIKGNRPDLKELKENKYSNLLIKTIEKCWEYEPQNRPLMLEIKEILNSIKI
jgi:hypothetical protein